MQRNERGFTVVEALVALLVLTLGVLPLVGGIGLATRLVGQGRRSLHAALVAERRIELLREAASQPPGCSALAAGSGTALDGVTVRWEVETPAAAPATRRLRVETRYPDPGGERVDSLVTLVWCGP